MIQASTTEGYSVRGFPDVCKTPSPSGPVPIPYPSIGATSFVGGLRLATTGTVTLQKLVPPSNSSRVPQLRSRLQTITSQLTGMTAGNPNQWHQLVDEYVVVSAELYLALSTR